MNSAVSVEHEIVSPYFGPSYDLCHMSSKVKTSFTHSFFKYSRTTLCYSLGFVVLVGNVSQAVTVTVNVLAFDASFFTCIHTHAHI